MEETSLVQQVLEWIQQRKPAYLAVKTATLRAVDFVGVMLVQNWPIMRSWLVYFGRLTLVVSQLWLECSLRGIGSLLRLGSAACFVLLWCSVLITTAMSGIFFMLISLGIACLAATSIGFSSAILVMAISGVMMLWMYSSFWITAALLITGGSLSTVTNARLAILIATVYFMYCAKVRMGWAGLVFCMNLAFITNDIFIYLMKSVEKENEEKCFNEKFEEIKRRERNFNDPPKSAASNDQPSRLYKNRPSAESSHTDKPSAESSHTDRPSADSSHTDRPSAESSHTDRPSADSSHTDRPSAESSQTDRPSAKSSQTGQSTQTSGEFTMSGSVEADPSLGNEVLRISSSSDHYATLGLSRYEKIDFVVLKREYRKKAILVHPDKNMGNVMAEESFKKLQIAYEVLSDLGKKNDYDEKLRREELTKSFHEKIQSATQKNGRYETANCSFNFEKEVKDIPAESRRIACRKCNRSHMWIHINRAKARARWCQDCEEYHQAKDGDGWMECSGHVLFFGQLQKVGMRHAYACLENTIFDISEWAACQGLNYSPNTHNPTFHVSPLPSGKKVVHGNNQPHERHTYPSRATNIDECWTEEDIFDWLHILFRKFDNANGFQESTVMKSSYFGKRNVKWNYTRRW